MKEIIQNPIGLGTKLSSGTFNINLCTVEDNLLGGTSSLTDCTACLHVGDLKRVLLRLRKRIANTLPLTPRQDEAERLIALDREVRAQLGHHNSEMKGAFADI